MDRETLTRVITERLQRYMKNTPNEGAGLYEKYIPSFVDAALKYPLFRNNPDLLPTIFIQETSAGRNVTRKNNVINYGVNNPTISANFARNDAITNLNNAIKEMGETGTVYRKYDTGKPLTPEELASFAKTYEPKNPAYRDYLVQGRRAFNDIANELGKVAGVTTSSPTASPTKAPLATPTPTQTRGTVAQLPGMVDSRVRISWPEDDGKITRYTNGKKIEETPSRDTNTQIQKAFNEGMNGVNLFLRPLANLIIPKPVFSAEKETNALETAINGFLKNAEVTQNKGAKTFSFYGPGGHEGTDYRAETGTNVYGLDGWVVSTVEPRNVGAYGKRVVLTNPNTGERIEFAHLDDTNVQIGDKVTGKTVIAKTGATGFRPDNQPQQAHLHVNYYDSKGNRADVTKMAQNVQKNPVAAAVDKAKSMFVPRPAVAAEPTPGATPKKQPVDPYSQKGWEQSQAQTFDQKVRSGYYTGKSQGNYQIKPGDTLSALAKQYNTTVKDFMRSNPSITDPNKILAGAVIKVPTAPSPASASSGYVVRSGDNLSTIAKNLGTTVADLVRKNNIANENLIYTGTRLKI